MFRIFIVLILVLFQAGIFAQDYPLNSFSHISINESSIYYNDASTSMRPLIGSEHHLFDSLIFNNSINNKEMSLMRRKIFHEHLHISNSEKYKLIINPIIDLRITRELQNKSKGFHNTRGLVIYGRLDSKIWFNSGFMENQAVFPDHINDFYSTFRIIPGYSRIKPFKNNGFDFTNAFGNISFKPIEILSFTLGTDRLFIGDGYRSVLLSDFASPYLYFKTSFRYKRIGFNHILTHTLNPNYNNIMGIDENWTLNTIYPGKIISYNYLTWDLNNYFRIGFFEAVVFDAEKENIWNYAALNPVTYLNTAYFGLDNINNALAGINISLQKEKIGIFYSQFLIDKISINPDREKFENRTAMQLGYKSFKFINIENLYVQLEYNHADVFTYTHSNPTQHYGQFNQSLAHPAGHGFDELLIMAKYSTNKFSVLTKINYIQYRIGGYFNLQNIFSQEPINNSIIVAKPGQIVIYSETQLIYTLNPAMGLQIFGGYILRREQLRNTQNSYIQLGIRTTLRRNYHDF